MKKWFALLVAVFLLLALPLSAVRAAETEPNLEQLIIDSCTYGVKVDISHYKLTKQDMEELYYRLLYEGRLPWYATYEYTYYYSEFDQLLTDFEPILLDESHDRMLYEQVVATILNDCIQEDMEDWQKALAIHDHLALRSIYDDSLELHSGYDLLVEGTAVCSGYASLYQDLLLREGIPCLQVESDEMDHAWNLVQLEGNWYHVDVTWDDPSPDIYGMVDHSYFLKTDEEMRQAEEPHYDWETDITCTDTRFADAFWNDVGSGIVFTDSNTCYYLRSDECRNTLYSRDIDQDKETQVYREKESYVDIGHGSYAYFHTGLSLRDGRLWICTMNQVLSMKPDGKDRKVEYTYDTGANSRCLAGCWAGEDGLYLTAMDHDGDPVTDTQPLPETDAHRHSFTQVVTAATCAEAGYTTAICDCGLTATGVPTATLEHSWKELEHEDASLFNPGYTHSQCTVCGAKETKVLSALTVGDLLKEYGILLIALISIPVSLLISKSKWKKN